MPGIDISQLAPLDEAFAPPPQAFAPPQQHGFAGQGHAAMYPQQHAQHAQQGYAPPQPHKQFAPPTGAFRPPAEEEAPLGVERSTRAIRIANQQHIEQIERELGVKPRASYPQMYGDPQPVPRKNTVGLIIALLLIAIVAIAVFLLVSKPSP